MKWFTDNQSVKLIVMHGSKRLHLQDGAFSIFETCMNFSLKLDVEWIPRDDNERAAFGGSSHKTYPSVLSCGYAGYIYQPGSRPHFGCWESILPISCTAGSRFGVISNYSWKGIVGITLELHCQRIL